MLKIVIFVCQTVRIKATAHRESIHVLKLENPLSANEKMPKIPVTKNE